MDSPIISLFEYFAHFVPKSVLQKIFIQPRGSRPACYDAIEAEILASSSRDVLPEIGAYIVSMNENFVSEHIKNVNEYILFVEYGNFHANYETSRGIRESLAITVAHSFSHTNADNLSEILWRQQCCYLLQKIIDAMHRDQNTVEFCTNTLLVDNHSDIQVVSPVNFYGCGGWSAMFNNANTEV
ncbi:hypothetical protein EZS27_004100 [termite gut metagenome]|uniref:Uncharacterized protein n=1 Tax=termite gut metagenome TaxID=433724 RepID=A0A5J4STB0_9ZZZZ